MQCIIMENTLIKLLHHDETKKTVSQCAKNKKCSKCHSLIYHGLLKGFQELELLLNSICRGLHTCMLALE